MSFRDHIIKPHHILGIIASLLLILNIDTLHLYMPAHSRVSVSGLSWVFNSIDND